MGDGIVPFTVGQDALGICLIEGKSGIVPKIAVERGPSGIGVSVVVDMTKF